VWRFEAIIKVPKGEKINIGKVGPWPPKAQLAQTCSVGKVCKGVCAGIKRWHRYANTQSSATYLRQCGVTDEEVSNFEIGRCYSIFKDKFDLIASDQVFKGMKQYGFFSPVILHVNENYSIAVPSFAAYDILYRFRDRPLQQLLQIATSVLLPEFTLVKFRPLIRIFKSRSVDVVKGAGNYIKFLDDPAKASQFADEIIDINRATEGGGTLLSGSPSSAINTASYYSTVPEQGASIFKTIIKNHMFADGNKRTAVNMFKSFCNKSGITTTLTDAQLMDVANKVATNQLDDVLEISQQLIK